jgi:hypothetical protein
MAIEPLTALGLATLFVTGAVQKGGQSVTEGAITLSQKLWGLIRSRLGHEQPKAQAILDLVERDPQPETLKRLKPFLEIELADPAFEQEVVQLVHQIQQTIDDSENQTNISMKVENATNSTIKQYGTVTINGAKEVNL